RPAGSAGVEYRAPTREELLRIEREVLTPLLGLANTSDPAGAKQAPSTFAAAGASARAAGLELRWLGGSTGSYFLLSDEGNGRGWILIRAGQAENLVLAVPRPQAEKGTLETALAAFEDLQARMLVIAGAEPDANRDAKTDVLAVANAASLFTLAHQAALRAMDTEPGAVLHVRAFGVRADAPAATEDALLSFDDGARDRNALTGAAAKVLRGLEDMGFNVRVGTGAEDSAGYDATTGPQASYMSQTRNKRFGALWISPLARQQLGEGALESGRRQFAALGMLVQQGAIEQALAERRMGTRRLPAALRESAEKYRQTQDIVLLSAMQKRFADLQFERFEDSGGRGAYLLVSDGSRSLVGVLALSAPARGDAQDRTAIAVPPGPLARQDVARFIRSRSQWMVIE
ncbi:MAG TPA: hypothetical protein VM406_01720, partial [Noviherbaspirillum sp.]|nr:hypothetical protein [Noviherbaspirillum sp.]